MKELVLQRRRIYDLNKPLMIYKDTSSVKLSLHLLFPSFLPKPKQTKT